MAHWLVKSEPSVWSWDQQAAAGAKGTHWNGVRNHLAKKHLMIAATRPDQFMDLSFIPFRQTETGLEAETNKDAANKIAAPENVTLASTTVSRGQR